MREFSLWSFAYFAEKAFSAGAQLNTKTFDYFNNSETLKKAN